LDISTAKYSHVTLQICYRHAQEHCWLSRSACLWPTAFTITHKNLRNFCISSGV